MQYALNHLGGSLEAKTLWDIMELECQEGWCKKQSIPPAQRTEDYYIQQMVQEFIMRSDITLNYVTAPNLVKKDYCFCFTTSGSNTVGGKFLQELRKRNLDLTSNQYFSKEIRRVQVHLRVPIRQWRHFGTVEADYVNYLSNPEILVDIYPNEQIASRLRELIEKKIDNTFTQSLDPLIASGLYDLDIFKKFTLCYVANLFPLKAGQTIGSPRVFCLDFPQGEIALGEEWNLFELINNVNRPERKVNDAWRPNKDVQGRISSLWDEKEGQHQSDKSIGALLSELEAKAKALEFPHAPVGKQDPLGEKGRSQLRLAMQAIVKEYVEAVRANLR